MPEVALGSIIILIFFMFWAFRENPKFKSRRKLVNVKYYCSTHLAEGLKGNKFVILKDLHCETCAKTKKEQERKK